MKILTLTKDGGPESHVWAYTLCEFKRAFSVILIHFKDGSREAYHNHAFDAVSWLLWGKLTEYTVRDARDRKPQVYRPSLVPIWTPRNRFHRVTSTRNSWALTFRGPWRDKWNELVDGKVITLTHGRKRVD